MSHPKPKFKVDDKVTMKKKTLYGETEGVVTEVEKVWRALCPYTGRQDGLVTPESQIGKGCLPSRFDGETYEVDYPEHDYGSGITKAYTQKSLFYGYVYTVKSAKMNTVYSDKSLVTRK